MFSDDQSRSVQIPQLFQDFSIQSFFTWIPCFLTVFFTSIKMLCTSGSWKKAWMVDSSLGLHRIALFRQASFSDIILAWNSTPFDNLVNFNFKYCKTNFFYLILVGQRSFDFYKYLTKKLKAPKHSAGVA